MKKLLLVLMVVAMASFLFVGCLGTGIISDNEEEEEEEPTPVTIAVDKEYTNAAGVTFVACGKDVIVTLPTAVETDYVVYVAQKVETAGVILMRIMSLVI
jgi:small ligand-binding sensory domain FIST